MKSSCFCDFTQTTDCTADSSSGRGRHRPSATCDCFLARTTVPNPNSGPLHGILATECASIASVLSDFHLLDLLTQGSTITSTVLASNANLSSAFGHFGRGKDRDKSCKGRRNRVGSRDQIQIKPHPQPGREIPQFEREIEDCSTRVPTEYNTLSRVRAFLLLIFAV